MDSSTAGGATSLAQEVQAQTDRDCETWQELITSQDEFVASLLEVRAALQQRLHEAQQAVADSDTNAAIEAEEKRLHASLARLESQVAAARETYQDRLKTQEELEKTLANIEAQLTQVELESTGELVNPPQTTLRGKKDRSPPFALVFINGTVAPFSDKLIQDGSLGGKEASDILRNQVELDLSLTDEGEMTTLCFLYYNRAQLVPTLERNRIISNPSTWKNFVDTFSRITGNFVVDVTSTPDLRPAEHHIAAVVSKFGFMPNLQQIYLAGVHPDHGVGAFIGQLDDSTAGLPEAFVKQVMPKINLVQHLPDYRMGDLVNATIEFAGLFESSIALPLVHAATSSAAMRVQPPSTNLPGPSTSGSCGKEPHDDAWSVATPVSNSVRTGQLKLDSTKSLLNQEPPLCFWHYLDDRGCTARVCTRSHAYRLTGEQTSRLRNLVKNYYPTGKCRWSMKHGTPCMFSHDAKLAAKWK
ncbi:hypothetical protein JCM10449v2_002023 [Rhodotorula kratochvilovae]